MSNGRDIAKLAKRAHALSDSIVGVGKLKDWVELIKIFRRPGWTTPAEFVFANGILDAMLAQTQALARMKDALLKGSNAVGKAR
jgi:hypothetical protein